MRPRKKIFRLGIDLGGTKIEAVILNNNNEVIYKKRIMTEQEKGYDHILNNIHMLYQEMVENIPGENHTFGIGTPGSINRKTGLMKNANILSMNGKPFIQDLEKKIRKKSLKTK